MKITTDNEYFDTLERIVKGAEYLESPLINDIDKAKGMKLYDKLCREVEEYQLDCRSRGHCITDHRTGKEISSNESHGGAA